MKLRCINQALRPVARKALQAGDVERFFAYTNNMYSMTLLADNHEEFEKRGLYERALLRAWLNQKVTYQRIGETFFSWGRQVGESLLECDRTKLMQASDPLPEGDIFTIYRSVWGDAGQEARGIAWTLSLKVAQRFAQGFADNFWTGAGVGDGVGEVYTTQVKRSDVFAYINESGRGEQEILVVLPDSHPVIKLSSREATLRKEIPAV